MPACGLNLMDDIALDIGVTREIIPCPLSVLDLICEAV